MSTAEFIYQKSKVLPRPLQAEALHFVEYRLTQEAMKVEATDLKSLFATIPGEN